VPERESAQPRTGRLRCRHLEASQLTLHVIRAGDDQVIKTVRTQRDRLRDRSDKLGLGQAPRPLLHMHMRIDRRRDTDRSQRLPQQLGTAVGSNRAIGRPNAYAHLGDASRVQGMRSLNNPILPKREAFSADAPTTSAPVQVDLSS